MYVSARAGVETTTDADHRPRLHLGYLDGLRGLAALYVVLHHASLELHYRLNGSDFPPGFFKLLKFLDFGHYAVDVFIVLSGYCLMLPVARSLDGKLRGRLADYFVRRARRILPPYYAAVVLSLIAIFVLHILTAKAGIAYPEWRHDFSPRVLLSHLFVIHNVVPGSTMTVNTPLWSVATEWQIYFMFPLLLWINRRWGIIPTVLSAFAVGLAPHYMLHEAFDRAYPWYIGLFALGMFGSLVSMSNRPDYVDWRRKLPWATVSTVLWIGLAVVGILASGWYNSHRWLADPLFGLATVCLLIHCTQLLQSGGNVPRVSVVSTLNGRIAIALGSFSYSLYLIHFPLLSIGNVALICLHLSPAARVVCLFCVIVPLIVLCADQFSRAFERPFLSKVP